MSNKKYKVVQRKLIETRLEVAICPYCENEMKFETPIYFDPEKQLLMGFQHRCMDCNKITILPIKYPRKVDIFEDDGEIVNCESVYTEDDTEGMIPTCTMTQ